MVLRFSSVEVKPLSFLDRFVSEGIFMGGASGGGEAVLSSTCRDDGT